MPRACCDDEASAVERLTIKLAQIGVKSYVRRVNGKTIKVKQHDRKALKSALKEVGTTKATTKATTSARPAGPALKPKDGAPTDKNGFPQPDIPDKPLDDEAAPPKFTPPAAEGLKGSGTKDDPYLTDDIEKAAELLAKNHWVRLDHERRASTLIDKLADLVEDAKKKGEKAPVYDLCKVTVEGTNLFCVESKGINRIQMPQLGGIPTPGSKADKFPKDKKGEVNLGEEFLRFLIENRKVAVKEEAIPAEMLKASQNQLNGGKVAGMARAHETGAFDPAKDPIFVSNDDYVVDGHHRWAATIAKSIRTQKRVPINTRVVDMDIITLLAVANNWSKSMGIKQAAV